MWRIEPIPFDPGLVAAARDACGRVAGEPAELSSGALHDAAEVARVLPAAMLFAPSADLAVAIQTFAALAGRALAMVD